MRIFVSLTLVSVTLVAGTSAYGYKLSRNPYSGDCKLQLNLPGSGVKDAYSGVMNTRYGGDGSKYFGAASSPHSSLASGHHGVGGVFGATHTLTRPVNNYGGLGTGSSYGSGASSGSNYGSSSSNYNSYQKGSAASGSYGSGSSAYGSGSSGSYGSGSDAYGSGSLGNYGAASGSYGSASKGAYGSSNYEPALAPNYGGSAASGYDDDDYKTKNYEASSAGSNYASSLSNNRGTSSIRDRDRDYDRRPSASYPGAGSSEYDRENYGSSNSRESSYEASSSKFAAASGSASGHRGSSHSTSALDPYRPVSDRYSPSPALGGGIGGGIRGSGSSSLAGSSLNSGLAGSSLSSSSAEKYGNRNKTPLSESEYTLKEFADDILDSHNSYRAKHNTPPLALDPKLSLKAQEWATVLARGRVAYGHSDDALDGIYGENLEILNYPHTVGGDVVDKWYREIKNYDYRDPLVVKTPKSLRNSHFTAVVWKATRKIGVGKATGKDGRTYVVVNYWPPGNIVDVLEANVLPARRGVSSVKGTFY